MGKLLRIVTNPVRKSRDWFRSKFPKLSSGITKVRTTVRNHPIITTTAMFAFCLGLNYVTGLLWIGAALFVLSMILFSSTSAMSGALRTLTASTEVAYGVVLLLFAAALVTPLSTQWLVMLLIPFSLWMVKMIHDSLGLLTFYSELRDIGEGTPEELAV